MVEIPENEVTQKDLDTWFLAKKELAKLKVSEMLLRTKIFKFFFKAPKEGTNKFELADHWELKAVHSIDRKVDHAAFVALKDQLVANGISPQKIVEYKPELKLSEYRELTEEQRHIVDQFLIIKPGSPQLDITLPAKYKPK